MKNALLGVACCFFVSATFAQNDQLQKQQQHVQLRSAATDPVVLASNLRSDTMDILNYTISLNITDFTGNTIAGNTVVTFTPKINGLATLRLDLLMLTVDSIRTGASTLAYSYNDTLLFVHLPGIYNIGDTSSVTVYYHGTPQGDASGWGGFYFQSPYAYNLGVGFAALPHVYGRVWFPCFDNFVERSTYQFNITTNGGKLAYCNGYLATDTTDGLGNRTRTWIMPQTMPSYLASVSVAPYAEIDQVYHGIAADVPIVIAAVASDTTAVKNSFVNLPVALATFENHFGAYKWNRVGYCMVPFNSGAMEHATNISYPKATATGSLTYQNLYAHELSHHWFGDLATCRTPQDMWLNEGWAHYCEYLFAEALAGYPAYLAGIRTNHEDNLHFNTAKEGVLSLNNIPETYTYGDHVYNKGADVAHTLRGYLGDSLFFYSVKTYLAQNNYKDVSSVDFRDALSAASGVNLNDFFDDWVFNPGWPHFSIDSFAVAPAGSNYAVTVYVKQKLTDAPNYFTNVPLEMTFKAADWTEQTQSFVMSGPYASFNFTVPFNPVFVAVDMGEKISHAVAPDFKKLTATGSFNFANAKMNVTVTAITDSVFMRIEHNYTAPDSFKSCCIPYRLSSERYWKVDGIFSPGFKAKGTITYEGRTTSFTGNYYLDDQLFSTGTEDSLVLMYRRNAADDWSEYPYYTKNVISSVTDKHGIITIDSLVKGEYVLAMHDYALGIQQLNSNNQASSVTVFPNPTGTSVTIDYSGKLDDAVSVIQVLDMQGKLITEKVVPKKIQSTRLDCSNWKNGVYFVQWKQSNHLLAKGKLVIAH